MFYAQILNEMLQSLDKDPPHEFLLTSSQVIFQKFVQNSNKPLELGSVKYI